MAQQSGFFKVTGALVGAAVLTMSLAAAPGASFFVSALIGIIGGGGAGGIVGGVVDTVINKTVGSALLGSYHHNPKVRKIQRESERDGRQETNLNRREAETRFRLIEKDQEKDEVQREWQDKVEAERAAIDKNVYSSGR